MSRYVLIGILGIFIAVSLVYIIWGRQPHQVGESGSSLEKDDEIHRLEAKIDKMSKEMRRVSMQSAVTARMNAQPNPFPFQVENGEGDGPAAVSPQETAAMMENNARELAVRYNRLSETLDSEPRDPTWATDAESEIQAVVEHLRNSGSLAGATILSTECRRNMCKVETTYDSADSQRSVSDTIRSPFFAGGEVRRFEENGALRSTAFFYRDGFEVPK